MGLVFTRLGHKLTALADHTTTCNRRSRMAWVDSRICLATGNGHLSQAPPKESVKSTFTNSLKMDSTSLLSQGHKLTWRKSPKKPDL